MDKLSRAAEEGDFIGLLAPAVRDRLLKGSPREFYRAGTVFYAPGAGARVLIVNSGLVRIFFQDSEGSQATLLFGATNSLIGVINVFGEIPDFHAEAVLDTVAISIDIHTFRNLIAEDAQTAAAVAAYLAARLRKTLELVTVRSLGTIRERLAYDLLERARIQQDHPGRFWLRATQGDLADSIGTAREVASRTLATLRAEGIVETGHGSVRIIDPVKLARIVRGLIG
jgi:CRP-like cAMP-binding protein